MSAQVQVREEVAFWQDLGARFVALAKRHTLQANKSDDGVWILDGNDSAKLAFTELANEGAKRKGFSGTPEDGVQYWLNCIKAPRW